VLHVARSAIEILSDVVELPRVHGFVRDSLRAVHGPALDKDTLTLLELAAVETASNIMKHAYHGDPNRPIRIEAEVSGQSVTVCFRHGGDPFHPGPPKAPCYEDPNSVGLGMHIISRSVDEVVYSQDIRGCNTVLLIKHLTGGRDASPSSSRQGGRP